MSAANIPKAPALWLRYAVEDYASARCLLLNGLLGGLILAQQAVEKLLKAYLATAYPDRTKFVGKGQLTLGTLAGVSPSHDLIAYFECAKDKFPFLAITPDQAELLRNLSYCFEGKYPDAATHLSSITTAWISDLDDLFFDWAIRLPMDDGARWRTGIYAQAWSVVLDGEADQPISRWIRLNNEAFQRALPTICQVVLEGNAKATSL